VLYLSVYFRLNLEDSTVEKLLAYLNSMNKTDQEAFAGSCQTTVGYLRKACSVGQELGAKISALIELHSDGAVTRADLHPEDWFIKWPELKKAG